MAAAAVGGSGGGGSSSSSPGLTGAGSFLGSLFGTKRAKAPPPPIIHPGPHYPAPGALPSSTGGPPLSPMSPTDGGAPSKIQALHAQYCHASAAVGQPPPPPYYHHHRYHMQTGPSPGQVQLTHAQLTHAHTLQRVTLPRRPLSNPATSHGPYPPLSQHALQQGRYIMASSNMAVSCPPPLSPHSPLSHHHPQFALFHTQPSPALLAARGGLVGGAGGVGAGPGKLPLTLSHSHPHPHAHSHTHVLTPHPGTHPVHQPHFVFGPPPLPPLSQAPSASVTAHHAPPGVQYLPQYPPLSSIPPPPPHSPLPPPSIPLTPLSPLSPLPPLHSGQPQPGAPPPPPLPAPPPPTGPGATGTIGSSKGKPTNRISTVV